MFVSYRLRSFNVLYNDCAKRSKPYWSDSEEVQANLRFGIKSYREYILHQGEIHNEQ